MICFDFRLEELRTLAQRKREALKGGQVNGDSFKACLNLWRETRHHLLQDDRFDNAITADPRLPITKKPWEKGARRLAEYALCHLMPAAGYGYWVRTLELDKEERDTVCAWNGVLESTLLALVRRAWRAQRVDTA